MPYRLVLQLNDRALHVPLAEGDLTLGSADGCDVRIPHYTVSRNHARLHVTASGVALTDLGSSNGTLVDGRRVEGRTELTPGRTIAFGSVEGRFEQVEADELESAVRVGPGGGDRGAAARAPLDGATTFSLGSIREFAVRSLPDLLDRALGDGDVRALAPAVGSALSDALPCSRVEIDGAGDAVIFRAGDEPAGAPTVRRTAEVPGCDLVIRVAFLSEPQATAYGPLVHAAAGLLGLADRADRAGRSARRGVPKGPASRHADPPSPPDPASVVPAVRRLYEDAARVAPGDVSVLICGESGTGKELFARFLHAASGRPDEAFVALNCAALPRDLLEAELFGVEEGAATGVAARAGKFELADGGTLFLDEIGDMAVATQAKILRALQEGEVYRIGGRSPRPARARVISATNRDVDAQLDGEALRRDLYHRIADWRVELPPLRERRADIPNLAAHFLDREVRRRDLRSAGISRAAMDVLSACDWPGNIRQLEREMARVALFLDEGELVETRHLQESLRRSAADAPAGGTLKEAVEEVERREILRVLDECGGDTRRAAELLGIGRSTLYRKMTALGIEGAVA